MNVSKLPTRRIGRRRETQTKEFDQADSELGSTVFENNWRDSIQTVSLPRIKARESLENVIIKNFSFRDEVVKGWRSRRNMPSIIQNRVGSKSLSEELSFREKKRQLWDHLVQNKEEKDEEVKLLEILLARWKKPREELELERF